MQDSRLYKFSPLKIRTLSDQRFLVVGVVLSFIFSVFLTGVVAASTFFNALVPVTIRNSTVTLAPPSIPPWEVFGSDKLTFILLGYDEVDKFAHRSDTLMVGAVDFYARSVRILSIPRDTLVRIPRHGVDKINAAYAIGGEERVLDTVQNFIGVDIDYVISVNYQGFIEVVDALGGVDIVVDKPMHYDDRRGNVHIHFEPGEYHMDGRQALEYARFRHDPLGDLGRIARQQKLMKALFEQAMKPSNWWALQRLPRAFLDNIKIMVNPEKAGKVPEIGVEQVVSMIGFLCRLDSDDIEFYQLPCVDVWWRGLSALRPIYSEARVMLSDVFRDDAPIAWESVQSDLGLFPQYEDEIPVSTIQDHSLDQD